MAGKIDVKNWSKYIEANLESELTTTILADQLNYSESQLKRKFRSYYKMSVSDYVRRRKMQKIAECMRNGMSCREAALRYGFRTYAGLLRAFQKEYFVSPFVYENGVYETILVAAEEAVGEAQVWNSNMNQNVEKIEVEVSILELRPVKLEGRCILQVDSQAEDDSHWQQQMAYWTLNGYPCQLSPRLSCNVEQREEKVAFWRQDERGAKKQYILGSILKEEDADYSGKEKDTDEISREQASGFLSGEETVKLSGGKYAVFQTKDMFDCESMTETLQLLVQTATSWMEENQEKIDASRVSYERYSNGKIYYCVPVEC